jgi:hypothetical protein
MHQRQLITPRALHLQRPAQTAAAALRMRTCQSRAGRQGGNFGEGRRVLADLAQIQGVDAGEDDASVRVHPGLDHGRRPRALFAPAVVVRQLRGVLISGSSRSDGEGVALDVKCTHLASTPGAVSLAAALGSGSDNACSAA